MNQRSNFNEGPLISHLLLDVSLTWTDEWTSLRAGSILASRRPRSSWLLIFTANDSKNTFEGSEQVLGREMKAPSHALVLARPFI